MKVFQKPDPTWTTINVPNGYDPYEYRYAWYTELSTFKTPIFKKKNMEFELWSLRYIVKSQYNTLAFPHCP